MINFAKTRSDAIIPTKNLEDAGYDLYACFDDKWEIFLPDSILIIPTGIASACDHLHYFRIAERGSTGTKGFSVRCGVVDSGFRDEWKVVLNNTGGHPWAIVKKEHIQEFKQNIGKLHPMCDIYPYEKAIAQAIYERVDESKVVEISYEELKKIPSKRGLGMLGSSGK